MSAAINGALLPTLQQHHSTDASARELKELFLIVKAQVVDPSWSSSALHKTSKLHTGLGNSGLASEGGCVALLCSASITRGKGRHRPIGWYQDSR